MTDGIHPWVAENRAKAGFGVCAVPLDGWSSVREIAEAAESLGFDSFWLADHPLAGYDSWTLLAALAGITRRLRLGTMVTCVYYRHPLQLARAVADVDRISNGRAVLGIGSGDMPFEFEQMGLGFPPAGERAAALEEALQFIPQLLRGEAVLRSRWARAAPARPGCAAAPRRSGSARPGSRRAVSASSSATAGMTSRAKRSRAAAEFAFTTKYSKPA